MFVDESEIRVKGGRGGHGCVSFRRERFIPKGGPDGGTGGDGGSVYIEATPGVATLLDFSGKHHWTAETGRPGEGNQRAGRSGKDEIIRLPCGTMVFDRETGVLLKDLVELGDRACVAAGGTGGRGNKSFAGPTNQLPREAELGQPGEERWLRLELKLIADVGLVGLPNAGKSTLLACLSKATPKIAPYPFTTLSPQLGIAELSDYRRLVLADIPGLIEGAHQGAGLGDAFLRHIERTRVIVHIIDICPMDGGSDPIESYHTIREELSRFSPALADKTELVVANKMDLSGSGEALAVLRGELGDDVVAISAVSRKGLGELSERMWDLVARTKPTIPPEPAVPTREPPHLREPS